MPCRDYDCERAVRSHNNTFLMMQNKLDKLTRMLCDVLGKWEDRRNGSGCIYLSTETEKWWEEHKFMDKQRLAQELKDAEEKRLLKSAISKLTPEELAAIRKGS
jgi:hypothetical protein